jgi:TonB family protein
MIRTRILCLLAISFLGRVVVNTQETKTENKPIYPTNGVTADNRVSQADDSQTQFISLLAEKISQMRDFRAASYQLARIADLIWNRNPTYARELFIRSLEKAAFNEEDSEAEKLLKNEARRRIFSLIVKRDSTWAGQLIDAIATKTKAREESCQNSELNVAAALDLVEDNPKLAATFAARSLQNGVSANFVTLLQKLRQENRDSADKLFLHSLAQYLQQTDPDTYQLLVLGTYLFKSPLENNENVTAFSLTRFGNVGIPNLMANQPGVSSPLVRAYLTTAILIMRRPSPDVTQQQYKYALGYLLLPKAQEFAPELMNEISIAKSELGSRLPSELIKDEAFAHLKKSSLPTPEERIEKINELSDERSRDANYLDIVFQAWLKENFAVAKTSAAKISIKEIQSTLDILIGFGEANALLKQRQPNLLGAERLAAFLPQSAERALLHLEIAGAAVKSKDKLAAFENLQAAAKTARQIPDVRRSHLLLAIAAAFAAFDHDQARLVLNEAIQAFNQFENPGVVKWETAVTIEPLTLRFPLTTEAKLSFENSVQRLLPLIQTETAFEGIKNEQLRAKAFVVLARFTLAKDETIVTVGEDGIRRSAAKTVMPAYPEEAKKKRVKGVVVIELQYDGNGDVASTKVLQSPDSNIGEAVQSAVKQWKFKPSKLEGKPISIRGKLTFYFVIDKEGNAEVRNPKQYQ